MGARDGTPLRRGMIVVAVLVVALGASTVLARYAHLFGEPQSPAVATVASTVPSVGLNLTPTIPPVPIPVYPIVRLDGSETSTGEFRDRVTLLNVWATWCAPCVRELPSLARLHAALGGPAFEVAALSLDRGGPYQVDRFLERSGIADLPIYLDPKGVSMMELRLRGLPTTLVIDREGREVARLEGEAAWDGEAARAAMLAFVEGGS